MTDDEEDRLRALILGRLGFPFELAFSYPQRIERSPAGKFEEFVSRVGSEASAPAAIGSGRP